jgi:hypothetical protein
MPFRSIFEPGCNVGRDLERLRHQNRSLELIGMAINEAAVADGRERCGLESLGARPPRTAC